MAKRSEIPKPRCLRCHAGPEWIEGKVAREPYEEAEIPLTLAQLERAAMRWYKHYYSHLLAGTGWTCEDKRFGDTCGAHARWLAKQKGKRSER